MKTCNPKYADLIPDLIRLATGALPQRLIPIPTFPDTIVYEADMMLLDWGRLPLLVNGYELDARAREQFHSTFHLYAVLQAIPWARKWHARGAVHTVEWLKTTIREAQPILDL